MCHAACLAGNQHHDQHLHAELKAEAEAAQIKTKQVFWSLPAKNFAAARRRKKCQHYFTARFVGDCQFDLSCISYGKFKRLGGLSDQGESDGRSGMC